MKKILREIFSVQNINNHKVFSILGIKIKFALSRGGGDRQYLNKKISVLEDKLKKITPKAYLEQFEIHITDHCNLNCKSCSHWAPVADEFYISIENFTKDLTRMKELTQAYVDRVVLLGGEPLLHPQIIELIEITSNLFPKSEIIILTNGILVNKMDEKFWQALKDNNVKLETTQYPINKIL